MILRCNKLICQAVTVAKHKPQCDVCRDTSLFSQPTMIQIVQCYNNTPTFNSLSNNTNFNKIP